MREFAGAIIGSDGSECSQITFPLNRRRILETSIEILYQTNTLKKQKTKKKPSPLRFATLRKFFFFFSHYAALCMYLWKNTAVSYTFKNSSSCTASPSPFCLYLWSLIVTSKSSIQHHPLQLPLPLASRCHDLFSGCLNRLAVIKSYAPLMTLS